MKAVIQRVQEARVTVARDVVGEIGAGMLILLGIMKGDREAEAIRLAERIAHFRFFEDEDGKMNLSVLQLNEGSPPDPGHHGGPSVASAQPATGLTPAGRASKGEAAQGQGRSGSLSGRAQILLVSQFTLAADGRKGRRPSFDRAEEPDRARELVQFFGDHLRGHGLRVAEGRFGAKMSVHLCNDGPVTFALEEEFQGG